MIRPYLAAWEGREIRFHLLSLTLLHHFACVCQDIHKPMPIKKMVMCFLNWIVSSYKKFFKDLAQVLQLLLKITKHFITDC